jgi:ligand-binding sensor domain-containing protein
MRSTKAKAVASLVVRAGCWSGRPSDHRVIHQNRSRLRTAWTLALVWLFAIPVCAQQLSIRRYNISDGLAHGTVTSIYQDAKGYLWFSTFEGLSRFDGYRFANYDTSDGLGHPITNHVTEDRQGRLWVATNGGGVARLLEEPPSVGANHAAAQRTGGNKFVSFPVGDTPESNHVNRMLFDSQQNLWCLTDGGLYRAALTDPNLKFTAVASSNRGAFKALADRRGRLWFGVANELIEVRQNQIINHGPVGGASDDSITGIIEDRQGRLLVASERGLFEFVPPTAIEQRGQWGQLPLRYSRTPPAMVQATAKAKRISALRA